jgi:plastocyanin
MRVAGLALIVAALGIPSSGCGGDDPPARPGLVDVRDFSFAPSGSDVRAGEKVTWENGGEQIHNVRGRGFFSRAIPAGGSYSFTFEKPGAYDYLCTLHPQMKGTITVE